MLTAVKIMDVPNASSHEGVPEIFLTFNGTL